MKEHPRRYFSYLLRFWQAESDQVDVWRASLEDPQTGEVLGFDHPDTLFLYLAQEMEVRVEPKTEQSRPKIDV